MQVNGTTYYYVTNLQGDVMGLVDTSGNSVAAYTYDPYGKVLTATGTLAEKNPLRYRGYYYDSESGLYYVSSRYYDANTHRFVNADDTSYLGLGSSQLSLNLFAYCVNNPVNRFDDAGNLSLPNWAKVVIGVTATVAAVVVTVATGGAALPVLAGVAASTVGGQLAEQLTTAFLLEAGKVQERLLLMRRLPS